MRPASRALLFALPLLALAVNAPAQTSSPNAGAVLSLHTAPLRAPILVVPQPDSGALALMLDLRNGVQEIYAQRVDRRGRPVLGEDGVFVCRPAGNEYVEDYLDDGSGGALLVLSTNRGASGLDIVVRRVLPDGSQPYGPNGLVVCDATRDQIRPRLARGPADSYYVGWVDDRANAGYYQDLFVQRLSLAGAAQWSANGVQANAAAHRVSSGNGFTGWGSDLQGGLLMIWSTSGSPAARTQRMNSGGALLWTANGIALGTSNNYIWDLAPDGSGGFWAQRSSWDGTSNRYFVHHVLGAGTDATGTGGIEFVSPVYQGALQVKLVRNATGGCFAFAMRTYYSSTSPSHPFLRQEIASDGTLLRGPDGEHITSVLDQPAVVESNGSILVAMHELLLAAPVSWQRVQRYALDGTPHYPGTGILVGRQNLLQYVIATSLALDAGGNLYAAWGDSRYSSPSLPGNYQAFGQAITPAGAPLWDDAEVPVLRSALDAANDQGGYVRVTWDRSAADHPAAQAVTGYRVWRALPEAAAATFARARPAGDGIFKLGARTLLVQAGLYWELAGEQAAATLPQYALTVPTMQDSVAGDPATQTFMVEAFDDSSHHWFSGTLDARSVDNLAPGAIASAVGFYANGTTSLYWNGVADGDLCCYDVFRGHTPGFVPGEGNRVASTSQLSAADGHGAPAYYRIAARDIHGNLGPSALVIPQGTLAADGEGPADWRLRSAWRAVGGALELSLDVPQADEGRVELFDVSGRRLWSREFRVDAARTLAFRVEAGAALRPGLVYARATSASGHSVTSKAVVLK